MIRHVRQIFSKKREKIVISGHKY